jgi:tetratricopeptide (TPR) repeat protein
MDNLEYIDRYFKKELSPEDSSLFEEKIASDPAFAEEAAFYLSALQLAGEQTRVEQKQRFLELYGNHPLSKKKSPVRKLGYYLAAAAVITGILFGARLIFKIVPTQQLADRYISENFQTLGVQMSSREDSIQTGLRLYNEGKTTEALQHFEKIIRTDTANFTAKEYAGIISLRLRDYDKALAYFEELETYSTLYANPALLYQAVTLMERNRTGDAGRAKNILQEIVRKNAEGTKIAKEWLHKW